MLRNRLSLLTGERRVSIQEIARATGLSYTTVFNLWHERSTRLDLETLNRLCAYFSVQPSAILEWHDGGAQA